MIVVVLVGVMSDTHDRLDTTRTAVRFARNEGIEILIHLGDIVSPFTLKLIAEELRGTRIVAIYGNNCGEKLGLKRVAERYGVELYEPPYTLELGDRRLLLLHGWGSKENTRAIVNALAVSNHWDAILYGHTHEVDLRRADGTLILNPGAASGYLAEYPTMAFLDTDEMRARIWRIGRD